MNIDLSPNMSDGVDTKQTEQKHALGSFSSIDERNNTGDDEQEHITVINCKHTTDTGSIFIKNEVKTDIETTVDNANYEQLLLSERKQVITGCEITDIPSHEQQLTNVLRDTFDFGTFRNGQLDIIRHICRKNDVFACMATGSGKSLCYQIPGIFLNGVALVVSPMISLQKDQVHTLLKKSVPAAYINSELGTQKTDEIKAGLLDGKYKLLYISPERLMSNDMRMLLPKLDISFVAIDECHCISQWGHDFRPSYGKISEIREFLPRVNIAAFTGTATKDVINDVVTSLQLNAPFIYIGNANRSNLKYMVINKHTNGELQLCSLIKDEIKKNVGNTVLVYIFKKSTIQKLHTYLVSQGLTVSMYHADMKKNEKEDSYYAFLNSTVNVLLATVAFGMGIDKPNVRLVVHYDTPSTIENYLQETGRAGRDAKPSRCILLFSEKETKQRFFILNTKRQKNMLRTMIEYAQTTQCRRCVLNTFFDETAKVIPCDEIKCDLCELSCKST